MTVKTCSQCGEAKELREFYRQRRASGDYYVIARCKACVKSAITARYWDDPESRRAYARAQWEIHRETRRQYRDAYYAEHREEINARRRRQRLEHLEEARAHDRQWAAANDRDRRALLTRRGLDPQSFEDLLASQNGVCAICQGPPNGKDDQFHIDHDHATQGKEVRGLLCHSCNTALGGFGDSVERLRAAIRYLETWTTSPWRAKACSPSGPQRPAASRRL